jgi:diguanylate cyclase (GGDEF)-like protein/PAS domain S-box-containing protein
VKLPQLNRVVLLAYTAVLGLATFGFYELWASRMTAALRLSGESLQAMAASVDATAKSATDHVAILRVEAERALLDRLPDRPHPLRRALAPFPDDRHFALTGLPPGVPPEQAVYLAGQGNPAALAPAQAQEIEAALHLVPLFHRVQQNLPQAAWVYYTSASRFVSVYPLEAQWEHLPWSDAMLAHPVFANTAPERNPLRAQRWSEAYVDEAGKGLMSSVTAPVADGTGRFRGMVALDITLTTLNTYLGGPGLDIGRVFLANEHGQLLADAALVKGDDKTIRDIDTVLPASVGGTFAQLAGSASGYRERGDWLLRGVDLKHAPWTAYHLIERRHLEWTTLSQMHLEIAALLLIMLSVLLIEWRRRAAQRLQDFDRTLTQRSLQYLTERKLMDKLMSKAMVVFNASSQGIMTTDANRIITSVNPAFTAITGYTPDEVIGRKPSILSSGRHDADFYQGMWDSLDRTGQWESEIWNRRKNGEIYPQWQTISAVRDEHGDVIAYISLFNDITQRKLQEAAIWRQANFDALTGLANRSLLQDRLDQALTHARRTRSRVGVLFLDLDGFKWINDTLGHDTGDELLVEVARRLTFCVREQDTVARLGGDEFTIIVHDLVAPEDLNAIADKVVGVLRDPFSLAGIQHRMSGSVGITVYPDDGEDVQTLFRNADIAMYKAKQAGKNRFQFYARDMQTDALVRLQLEADLRTALENHAFTLHYQPIVDADSGELVGAEALIRWVHPVRGPVSPLEFIPVAEDSGLIIGIGEWALREAARQSRQWRDLGHATLRLAVNMSGVQFREAGLADLVGGVLAEFGIDRDCLLVEITESVLMGGSESMETRMRDIKALGIGYALDDFGTGFSSLSYLKRFPVDIVKIDRSFVDGCPDDRNDAHLVEAIINMAHSLDLQVTAEGVETDEQVSFLRDLGCDFLQGYVISKPLPAAEFEELIKRHFLLPSVDGASPEEARLLTALREDQLDVDLWLRRLLGERTPELATFMAREGWTRHGLDLKHAVEAHLDWRKRLNDYVLGHPSAIPLDIDHAGSVSHCTLGQWIERHTELPDRNLAALDRMHREFHKLAGQIVADYSQGYQASARRTLAGLKFRTASRDVVIALIDCFDTAAESLD